METETTIEIEQDPKPTLSPKLLTDDKEMLVRAVEKWLKFQNSIWNQINLNLERTIKAQYRTATILRIVIICLSALLTTISNSNDIPRTVVTIAAGSMTALTGIEAFLKLNERQAEARKQQREIEALRDRLRFEWFVNVEVEKNMQERLSNAKKLLEEGPKTYNELLNKYALKAEGGEAPKLNA